MVRSPSLARGRPLAATLSAVSLVLGPPAVFTKNNIDKFGF